MGRQIILKVKEFTEYPGPRYQHQGKKSGEEYYYEVLKKEFTNAMQSDSTLVIDLDGTAGYASSFIDEAFGNLIYDFDYSEITKRIEILSLREPDWIELVKNDIFQEWKQKKENNSPRKPTELPPYKSNEED